MLRGIKKISSNNSNHIFPAAITVIMKQSLTHLTLLMPSMTILLKLLNIQSSIRFPKKKYDCLPPLNIESFFLTPTDSTEVSNIIFSLNQNKSDGPNSIPIKILKLLNKAISDELTILFNQSFSSGMFPSILKTSKIIPIYKKGSKLECSNYRPISLRHFVNQHPTSQQTSHIPHPEHPTCRTSHILKISHPEHPTSRTSRTSHIPNIPHPKHPEHPTSRTSHIPNISHPEHPTTRTFHVPNIPHPRHSTFQTSYISSIPHPEHPTTRQKHHMA